jgi:hypothetical protein
MLLRTAGGDRHRAIVSVHESGHAISGVLLRLFFATATMEPPQVSFGEQLKFHSGPAVRIRRVLFALAGGAATDLVWNEPDVGCDYDLKVARKRLAKMDNAPSIEYLHDVALAILTEHHGPLIATARALLECGTLSYEEVRWIVTANGAPLRTERLLEQYGLD